MPLDAWCEVHGRKRWRRRTKLQDPIEATDCCYSRRLIRPVEKMMGSGWTVVSTARAEMGCVSVVVVVIGSGGFDRCGCLRAK